jgi:acylphosphatase
MQKIGMQVWVSGLVQGVFYRRFVQREALKLGITGWACNLPDGRVESLLCGEQSDIEQLITLLWSGPSKASVEKVQSQEVAWQNFKDFEIR